MKLPTYDFKFLAELGWIVVIAVGVAVLTVLVEFDPAAITDWKAWGMGIVGGAVRAGAGAALALLGKRSVD